MIFTVQPERKLTMPKSHHLRGQTDIAIKVLIIYDDFDLAAKTSITLRRAAKNSNVSILWNIKVWRTDIIRLRPFNEVALQDGIEAQLIIFALNPAETLPIGLSEWLEMWAEQRQIPDVTLAAASQENNSELSIFASRNGLNFITDVSLDQKNGMDLIAMFLPASKPAVSIFQPRFITEKLQAAYRGWGINE
jgi:hypothetical protein